MKDESDAIRSAEVIAMALAEAARAGKELAGAKKVDKDETEKA